MMEKNENQLVFKPKTSNSTMQEMYWSNESKIGKGKNMFQQYKIRAGDTLLAMNSLFQQVVGIHITLSLSANQLTFKQIQVPALFKGKVVQVTNGYITLDSVILPLTPLEDYCFNTPLHFPIERISNFTVEEFSYEK